MLFPRTRATISSIDRVEWPMVWMGMSSPVIPSRRNPGGVKRGEESPAETADERAAATGRGFLAVLGPSGASAARNDSRFYRIMHPSHRFSLPFHGLLQRARPAAQ